MRPRGLEQVVDRGAAVAAQVDAVPDRAVDLARLDLRLAKGCERLGKLSRLALLREGTRRNVGLGGRSSTVHALPGSHDRVGVESVECGKGRSRAGLPAIGVGK